MDFDYQKLGAGYYDRIFEQRRGLRRFWHGFRFEMLESFLPCRAGMRILDAGCAAGSFLGRLKSPFVTAVGVDISGTQIQYAREKYSDKRIEFIAADIMAFENKGAAFDVIVLSEVLEHIAYPQAVELLRRLKSSLAPGGRLVVTTPNYRSLWPFLEFFVNRFSPVSYEHQHVNKLDSRRLAALLNAAGFKPQTTRTFFVLAPFLSFISYRLACRASRLESRLLPRAGCLLIASASASQP